MDEKRLQEVLAVIGGERRPFPYFRDRYALLLISDFVGEGCRVSTLRQSHLRQLLEKPTVKQLLARCGGWLNSEMLAGFWPEAGEQYSVTFGQWGDVEDWDRSWDQMVRRGKNLVVQLNFTGRHDALFRALQSHFGESDYNSGSHPVNRKLLTLGWVRVDIDEEYNEALIEEVQSDWIEDAMSDLRENRSIFYESPSRIEWRGKMVPALEIIDRYVAEIDRHRRIWHEAALSAALEILRTEFKCRDVYYHTVASNRHLKEFSDGWQPPRSIYTDLPRRFCFERVANAPRFLQRDADGFARYKLNRCELEWHRLQFKYN